MFNFDDFQMPVIKKASKGDVEIVKNEEVFFLYVDGELNMKENPEKKLSAKEFYGNWDVAKGNVLCSGLGFGILPKMLSEKESVSSVTVVEKNQNVIDIFLENNNLSEKVKIINADIYDYIDSSTFDTILLDHYEEISLKDQLDDIRNLQKTLPRHKALFSWRIETLYTELFLQNYDRFNIDDKWEDFLIFANVPTFPKLEPGKIKDYFSVFAFGKPASYFENKNWQEFISNYFNK